VAAARGLALATGKPIVAATSLAVMAHGADARLGAARSGRYIAVAVDARRGMVFFQLFGDAGREPDPPRLLEPAQAARLVGGRPVVVVGSAGAAVADAIKAAGDEAEAELADLQPHARSLAEMAEQLAPVGTLHPLYLRPPDVKPQGDQSLARAAP
jgi:tRNA threonylcarbamoyladenosine biosynthesis protein TsaB